MSTSRGGPPAAPPDSEEPADRLLRDLRTSRRGLQSREAERSRSGAASWSGAAPFPFVVWGADELRRWVVRRRGPGEG
jgi:hypothetical protein